MRSNYNLFIQLVLREVVQSHNDQQKDGESDNPAADLKGDDPCGIEIVV